MINFTFYDMKKSLFSSAAVLLTATLFAQPQPRPDGPPKPPPLAERWKHDSTRLQLYVVLSPGQIAGIKTAFFSFYNDADALMQQHRDNSPTPPPKEEVEKMRTKWVAALKAIFDAQQFTRFQTFEKEFMPPHPPEPPTPQDANERL